VTRIAVIAHSGKTVDGGLPELRRVLAGHGVSDPLWAEVTKSRKAPKQLHRLLEQGAEHFVVWGGDGMAQRCIDTLAGTGSTVSIVPAGTSNLLASNLGIPKDIEGAVVTGLHGAERPIDVASLNGERFAVMAGAGFDADMIGGADGALKDRLGRAAYLWTGAKSMRTPSFGASIKVDGAPWYDGPATCVLAGNVGALFAGVEVFADAVPDDGRIDIAVITADGVAEWARTVARTVAGSPERSPFFRVTQGRKVKVKLDRKVPYELDGGARSKVKSYRLTVEPGAIMVRVPISANGNGGGRS
jgi:diacylglycerol kinase (ATP)